MQNPVNINEMEVQIENYINNLPHVDDCNGSQNTENLLVKTPCIPQPNENIYVQ